MVFLLYNNTPEKFKNLFFQFLVLTVSGIVIVFLNPHFSFFPTGCVFNKITGFLCPGCGMSRGIHSLFCGDINKAIHFNVLLVTALPLSMLWLIFRYTASKYCLNVKKYDNMVIAFFISIVIVYGIIRNIPSAHPVF